MAVTAILRVTEIGNVYDIFNCIKNSTLKMNQLLKMGDGAEVVQSPFKS